MIGRVIAGVGWSGAVQEGDVYAIGAGFVAEEVGRLIDLDHVDALGRGEVVGVGVLRKENCLFHELGPDGRGGVGAFDFDIGIVVVADPHDA